VGTGKLQTPLSSLPPPNSKTHWAMLHIDFIVLLPHNTKEDVKTYDQLFGFRKIWLTAFKNIEE